MKTLDLFRPAFAQLNGNLSHWTAAIVGLLKLERDESTEEVHQRWLAIVNDPTIDVDVRRAVSAEHAAALFQNAKRLGCEVVTKDDLPRGSLGWILLDADEARLWRFKATRRRDVRRTRSRIRAAKRLEASEPYARVAGRSGRRFDASIAVEDIERRRGIA